MVLKILILTLINFSIFSYEEIEGNYLNKKYEDVIELFEDEYESMKDAPVKDLHYYALALKEEKQFIKAHNISSYILKREHRDELLSVKSGEDASDELISTISNMLESYHLLYINRYDELSNQNKEKLEHSMEKYSKALETLPNYEGDLADDLVEKRESFFSNKKKIEYYWSHSIGLTYQLFEFDMMILGDSGKNDLLSNNSGFGFQYQIARQNSHNKYFGSISYSSSKSIISNLGGSINYTLPNGKTSSGKIELGWMKRFEEARVNFGLYVFAFNRKGDYAEPDEFEIKEQSETSIGGGIVTEYQFNDSISFSMKMANTKKLTSSLWEFGINYSF